MLELPYWITFLGFLIWDFSFPWKLFLLISFTIVFAGQKWETVLRIKKKMYVVFPYWRFWFNISFLNIYHLHISFFLSPWHLIEAGSLEHYWGLYYHCLTLEFPEDEQHSISKLCFIPILSASPFFQCVWLFPDRIPSIVRILVALGWTNLRSALFLEAPSITWALIPWVICIVPTSFICTVWWTWQIGRINWQLLFSPSRSSQISFFMNSYIKCLKCPWK